MKRPGTRVNLIPVIAKADTLTQSDLFTFKQRVRPYLYLKYINSDVMVRLRLYFVLVPLSSFLPVIYRASWRTGTP
jgi:hypothetical protein